MSFLYLFNGSQLSDCLSPRFFWIKFKCNGKFMKILSSTWWCDWDGFSKFFASYGYFSQCMSQCCNSGIVVLGEFRFDFSQLLMEWYLRFELGFDEAPVAWMFDASIKFNDHGLTCNIFTSLFSGESIPIVTVLSMLLISLMWAAVSFSFCISLFISLIFVCTFLFVMNNCNYFFVF